MKISVVTAVLNGEKFIQQTIESVLSQKGDFEVEYIIRDGKSSDQTMSIISEYKDRLQVVSQKDGSAQEAIIEGFKMATGDIYCWLNADDLFEPGALQKVAKAFQEKPHRNWLYGRCSIIDENNSEIRKPITWYKNILGYVYSSNVLLCENFINQPSTFWKAELWDKVQGLSTKFLAAWDYELWIKMSKYGAPIALHHYLAKFRRHPGTISENHFVRQFQEELEIAKDHGNFLHFIIHKINQLKIVATYKILK